MPPTKAERCAGYGVIRKGNIKKYLLFLIALIISFSTLGWMTTRPAALPPDFTDELVTDVSRPTALAFTPDGRLLIATQDGSLRVHQDGSLLPTPALNLSSVICSDSERGLLGIAVDPAFTVNHYIYLYYTFKKFEGCPRNDPESPVNRVSRFILPDDDVVMTTTQVLLLDNIPSPNGNHNAGDLHFGQDGYLYVSVGDGGCDYAGDSGCAGSNDAARDEHVLLGKILRITRDGAIPPSNPFQGAGTARCNTGSTTPGNQCQETFAWGLRNPFRFAFRPGTLQFHINDVGQNRWEEIDEGVSGADYGWNVREGHCVTGSSTNCPAPPAGMTDPIYDYNHNTGCSSITGGAFVPLGIWPVAYDNVYLFSDYVCGKVFQLVPNGGGGFSASEFASGLGNSSVVTMIFGPHNTTQALYYTTYAGGGQVRRISYTGTNNRSPVAVASANPTYGSSPLPVAFDASASSDLDGDPLSFDWDFGDGDVLTQTTDFTATHTYLADGVYTATLTAYDGQEGVSAPALVRIDVGNTPPTPTIIFPLTTTRFYVGQTLTLQGSALDAQDGALPESALSWEVVTHHIDGENPDNAHTHPFLPPTSGNNIPVTAPSPEDLQAAVLSYLEIRLTAADSSGLSTTITQTLEPDRVNITFATEPEGLNLVVNSNTLSTTQTIISWGGYALDVSAPVQLDGLEQAWAFESWSDGGARTHTITTPSSAITYTATFTPAIPLWLPIVFR
jgi:glucose/arabinose dehydrogenase